VIRSDASSLKVQRTGTAPWCARYTRVCRPPAAVSSISVQRSIAGHALDRVQCGRGAPVCNAWSMPVGPPTDAVATPASVLAIAGERPVKAVWNNFHGGTTFEIGAATDRCFVKWAPAGGPIELDDERARLAWAVAFAPVPRLLGHGRDAEGSWLVTAALPGTNAVEEHWKARPATAVAAIGAGLRALHDALPVADCPFSWSVEDRLADIRRNAARGAIDLQVRHPDHRHLDLERALALVADPPPIDRLVVCHGDTCAPNTLIGEDGRPTGHVDFGVLGVADRWADLAIATWSTQWNYGPGWELPLLEAYGIAPDDERTRYYRLLWDLAP
jgi:aminoglycoside phosphotransferase